MKFKKSTTIEYLQHTGVFYLFIFFIYIILFIFLFILF